MSELIETVTGHPVGEFIVLRGDLGEEVLWNVGGSWVEGWDSFVSEFEIDGKSYLGDPAEDHYQGTLFTRIIRRKSDGAVFGSHFWMNPGIDSIEGSSAGPDSESWGVEFDWESEEPEPVVFGPVQKFQRVGYEVVRPVS